MQEDPKGTHGNVASESDAAFEGKCQSCGMPIEGGPYCEHCVDEHGNLQRFEERFRRMVDFTLRQDPCIGREEAEVRTRAYMVTMPAWTDHPQLRERP